MSIGARLKLIRKRFNLKQDQVAELFDIGAETLSRYENGKRTPDNEFLEAFGKYFKVSGDWLLYNEPPIFRESSQQKRDVTESFLELSALIRSKPLPKTELPDSFKVSLDKLGEDTPQNFVTMLAYMIKDPLLRQKMFQIFHIVLKPSSDERMEHMEKGK
jgi:transcriptional regulator with XRE-family HTH domain